MIGRCLFFSCDTSWIFRVVIGAYEPFLLRDGWLQGDFIQVVMVIRNGIGQSMAVQFNFCNYSETSLYQDNHTSSGIILACLWEIVNL